MQPRLESMLGKLKTLVARAWFGSTERERWCLLIVAFLLIVGAGFKLLRLGGMV